MPNEHVVAHRGRGVATTARLVRGVGPHSVYYIRGSIGGAQSWPGACGQLAREVTLTQKRIGSTASSKILTQI